ncbi:hypothetical protein ACWD7Y_12915 [Streptomyces drozdowiczii]
MSDLHKEVSDLEQKSATAARLFDIRRIIGGLFVVYGIIVTIAGISPSDADLKTRMVRSSPQPTLTGASSS